MQKTVLENRAISSLPVKNAPITSLLTWMNTNALVAIATITGASMRLLLSWGKIDIVIKLACLILSKKICSDLVDSLEK